MLADIYPYRDAKEFVAAYRAVFPSDWQVVVFHEFKPMQDEYLFTLYLNPEDQDLMSEIKMDGKTISQFDNWFQFFQTIREAIENDIANGISEELNHENLPEPRLA